MAQTAKKTDPKLWDEVKTEVTKSSKGGEPGQWSARKAQMAVQDYKSRGGGYEGAKQEDTHLHAWTKEEWGTKSGEASGETGERYLPKTAREHLSKEEYARTTQKKRRDTKKGKQHSSQPKDVKKKTAEHRDGGKSEPTKAELYEKAKKQDISGRSKMSKAELAKAVK